MSSDTLKYDTIFIGGPSANNTVTIKPVNGKTLNIEGNVTGGGLSGSTLPDGKILIGQVDNTAGEFPVSGDATLSDAGVLTLKTVNANAGTSTFLHTTTTNGKGLVTGVAEYTNGNADFVGFSTTGHAAGYLFSGDMTTLGGGVMNLKNTGPGALTNIPLAKVSIDAKGRVTGLSQTALSPGDVFVGNGSSVATAVPITGDATLDSTGALTLADVNAAPGSTTLSNITTDSKGRVTSNSETALTNGKLWVGNGSNVPTEVSLSSGVTMTNTGVATVHLDGSVSGNLPVANLNSGLGATTGTFFRGDGTWAAVSGTVTPSPLTKTDDTNVTLTLGGSPTTALVNAASITVGWTGQLGVTRGGTGLSTTAQGDLLYSSALNTISSLPKDTTASRYLSNTGTSNNPAWAQVDLTNGVTGVLPKANGGTGIGTRAYGFCTGSNAQSLNNNWEVTLSTYWNPATTNGGITFSSGVWTMPRTGTYIICCSAVFAANATGNRLLNFMINSSLTPRYGYANLQASPGGNPTGLCSTVVMTLSAGDTVSVNVLQGSGGTLNMETGVIGFYAIAEI